VATAYQLGLLFHAGTPAGVLKTEAAVSSCAFASKRACAGGRSAAKSAGYLSGSR